MKNVMGFNFLGVTTDMALRLPFFRHYLGWIGTITASSHVVMKHVSGHTWWEARMSHSI